MIFIFFQYKLQIFLSLLNFNEFVNCHSSAQYRVRLKESCFRDIFWYWCITFSCFLHQKAVTAFTSTYTDPLRNYCLTFQAHSKSKLFLKLWRWSGFNYHWRRVRNHLKIWLGVNGWYTKYEFDAFWRKISNSLYSDSKIESSKCQK